MSYQSVYTLAQEMKNSEAYEEFIRLKEDVEQDETQKLLLKEYRNMQMNLQMSALSGQSPGKEQMDKFSALNSLLYSNPKVSAYLLAEMRLQQGLAEVIKILTQALNISFDIPNA